MFPAGILTVTRVSVMPNIVIYEILSFCAVCGDTLEKTEDRHMLGNVEKY